MKPNHVIILGCGRSGTSIFGELFQTFSCYHYTSEPDFADYLRSDFQHPIATKVPRESEGYPAPPGLSFPLETLQEKVSDVRIYWQVRHPLDTICSLKVGISKNWGHHPRPHDWQEWLNKPLIERCAHHWAYINTVGFEQVQNTCTISRFEDLISDPRQFALNICTANQIDPNAEAEAIDAWSSRVQDQNNDQFVEAMTSRPYSTRDHKVRVGRWKENLNEEEIAAILPIISKAAKGLNYELPTSP